MYEEASIAPTTRPVENQHWIRGAGGMVVARRSTTVVVVEEHAATRHALNAGRGPGIIVNAARCRSFPFDAIERHTRTLPTAGATSNGLPQRSATTEVRVRPSGPPESL